jgi:hypothetical protein
LETAMCWPLSQPGSLWFGMVRYLLISLPNGNRQNWLREQVGACSLALTLHVHAFRLFFELKSEHQTQNSRSWAPAGVGHGP